VWRVGRTPEARLLAGGWNDPTATTTRPGRRATRIGLVGMAVGALLLLAGAIRSEFAQGAFMGGGAVLLTSCLLLLSGQLRPKRRADSRAAPATSLPRLGMRNAARHTARSVLSAGLIAFAAFTLVTVASLKQGEPQDTHVKTSGAGGYRLILQSGIPLTGDLATPKGRELLGVADADIWRRVNFTSMRSWAGQDVSCLNLTKPDSPTILAVPSTSAWDGRFEFGRTIRDVKNGWELLDEAAGDPNTVPVVADNETAQYILKLSIGDTMAITDQRGVQRHLKLVGTIKHSIFQSELLMSEANFLRLFPAQSGFGTVLVETATADDAAEVQKRLNTELKDYAVTVDTTAARLAAYAQVANTYLSTFQTLGSLGLMLGAIGLGVVLLRGLVERRAELALLSAIGFRPASRVQLVLAENALLLVLGLAIGAGCALVGILPTLTSSTRTMNLPALAATLGGVLLCGLAALAVAVWVGQRRITTADLRAE
jgi:ABC-type antimicrobial peptide transport system permease subunit